jgi:hypothetical protein
MTINGQSDGQWFASIKTDNGGDQSYGPFRTEAVARDALKKIVEQDFDEEYRPELLRVECSEDD